MFILRIVVALVALLSFAQPARAQIVINEIMYNSPHAQDVEYVELFNAGTSAQSLAGWTLLDDDDLHPACPLEGTLAPGEFLVVAGDLLLFQGSYPGVTNLNPSAFGAGFSLGNGGDAVRVFDGQSVLVDGVAYGDAAPWPTAPDGGGPALELLNPSFDNALATSWAASVPGGTPGTQNSVFATEQPPTIGPVSRSIPLPEAGQAVTISAAVSDDQAVAGVELLVDLGAGFSASPMFDDGLHGDGPAGDSVFGATIDGQPHGTLVRYYLRATDDTALESFAPPAAPAEYLAYTVGHVPPQLVINEILASNQNGIRDEALQRDDWLEIANAGPHPVELGGMFLTEDLDQPRMWQIPAVNLPPGGRLLVWCDDEPQGAFHANFRLAAAGGLVALFDSVDRGNLLIHGLTFGVQSPDRSFGYLPEDGDAPEYLATPTPLSSNATSSLLSAVCINEFLTSSSQGVPDWIELFNRTASTVDIGGFSLTDDAGEPLKYTFPLGTTIAPGGVLSIDSVALGFALNNDGNEVLMLTQASGTIGMDFFDYGPQLTDQSQGRFPDGTANWHFFGSSSRDLSNSCSQGVPPPGPVPGLRFESPGTLAWDAVAGVTGYDVVRGDLGLLLAAAGDYSAAGIHCLENNGPDPLSWDGLTPAEHQGLFYLVRGVTDGCGYGSYESPETDAEIAASGADCP